MDRTGNYVILQGYFEPARLRRELDPRHGDVKLGRRAGGHKLHGKVHGFICSIEIWGIYSTFMWYFVVADRSPLGVAGLIVPWNLPLYLLTFKVSNKVKKKNRLNYIREICLASNEQMYARSPLP